MLGVGGLGGWRMWERGEGREGAWKIEGKEEGRGEIETGGEYEEEVGR